MGILSAGVRVVGGRVGLPGPPLAGETTRPRDTENGQGYEQLSVLERFITRARYETGGTMHHLHSSYTGELMRVALFSSVLLLDALYRWNSKCVSCCDVARVFLRDDVANSLDGMLLSSLKASGNAPNWR